MANSLALSMPEIPYSGIRNFPSARKIRTIFRIWSFLICLLLFPCLLVFPSARKTLLLSVDFLFQKVREYGQLPFSKYFFNRFSFVRLKVFAKEQSHYFCLGYCASVMDASSFSPYDLAMFAIRTCWQFSTKP